MFEQYQKQWQAILGQSAWSEQAKKAQEQSQLVLAEQFEATQKLMKMEMESLSQLAQARRPEEVIAALANATAKRQAFYTEALASAAERFKQGQTQLSQLAEGKATEATRQASQAVDAAFGGAKQGLEFVQSAAKSAVERAGKASGGQQG